MQNFWGKLSSLWTMWNKALTMTSSPKNVNFTERVSMGLSVWRETSKKLTVYRVCYTPIETLY